jgi:hypothetical protein
LYRSTFDHLFISGAQNPALFGGKSLTDKATPKEIAENMIELIKQVEIQKN